WVIFWLSLYSKPEDNKNVKKAELQFIQQDEAQDEPKRVPWKMAFSHRQTLGIAISFFLTAPVWWFFLYWLPKFFHSEDQVVLASIAMPLTVIYVVSDIGAIAGGWYSSRLVKRGMEAIKARKKMIFALALLVIPVIMVPYIHDLWIVILLIALAAFAHQGYASNIFTIIPDVFPK